MRLCVKNKGDYFEHLISQIEILLHLFCILFAFARTFRMPYVCFSTVGRQYVVSLYIQWFENYRTKSLKNVHEHFYRKKEISKVPELWYLYQTFKTSGNREYCSLKGKKIFDFFWASYISIFRKNYGDERTF